MNYENFVRQYLEFFPEDWWDKCVYHIMFEEGWTKDRCIKFANKLRRERLTPEDQNVGITEELICDSPNTPTKGSESSRND